MTNYTLRHKILILRYCIIEYIICYIKEEQKNITHINIYLLCKCDIFVHIHNIACSRLI